MCVLSDQGGLVVAVRARADRLPLEVRVHAVEKHVNSIFGKLGLVDGPVHRRVAAVLAFPRERPDS